MTNKLLLPARAPYTEKLVRSNHAGEFAFIKTQDVTEILRAAHEAKDMFKKDTGPVQGRYLGTVPVIIAQQWAKECGHAIGTKEWAKYAKTKLKDGEYSKLRIHS